MSAYDDHDLRIHLRDNIHNHISQREAERFDEALAAAKAEGRQEALDSFTERLDALQEGARRAGAREAVERIRAAVQNRTVLRLDEQKRAQYRHILDILDEEAVR